MKIFSLDGPFQKYGTILFDLMVLSFLWTLASAFSFGLLLPLATAGFLNAINLTMIAKDGYMLKGFFAPIKERFLKAIALNFTLLILIGFSSFNLYAVLSGMLNYVFLIPLYLVLFLEVSMCSIVSLALLMETDLGYKDLLKFGFALSNRHMLWSLLMGVIVIITIILAIIFTPLSLLITSPIAHLIVAEITHRKILANYHLDKLGEKR